MGAINNNNALMEDRVLALTPGDTVLLTKHPTVFPSFFLHPENVLGCSQLITLRDQDQDD